MIWQISATFFMMPLVCYRVSFLKSFALLFLPWLLSGAAAGLSKKWLLLQHGAGIVQEGLGCCDKAGREAWRACSRSGFSQVARRIGPFVWKRCYTADSTFESKCHCVLGFIALAGEPPILCRSKKSQHMLSFTEQDWPFLESSSKAYLSFSR